jgi:hypothetical protein
MSNWLMININEIQDIRHCISDCIKVRYLLSSMNGK